MSYLGNGSAAQKQLSEEQDFFEYLDRIFPNEPRSSEGLMILDGTSNQKTTILMWMGDQVINSIRKAAKDSHDQRKIYNLVILEHDFQTIFEKIRIKVGEVTESTSRHSEEWRKNYIEECAKVMDKYSKAVERITKSSHPSDAVSPINSEANFARETQNDPDYIQQCLNQRESDQSDNPKTSSVPMTPIVGIPGSIFISPKAKGISIHENAYADQHRESSKIPFDIDLNQTYQEVLHGIRKNLTYIGAKYPDGTSLSYLPVKHITLIQKQSFVQHPTQIEGGFVEISIPKIIYDSIKDKCSEAYLARYPDHVIRYPQERPDGSKIVRIHALARGYRRMRIINAGRTFHITLLEALSQCSHNMTGDGLIHLRFDRQKHDDKRATMKVIFFGLQMVRDSSNHFQKIFRL